MATASNGCHYFISEPLKNPAQTNECYRAKLFLLFFFTSWLARFLNRWFPPCGCFLCCWYSTNFCLRFSFGRWLSFWCCWLFGCFRTYIIKGEFFFSAFINNPDFNRSTIFKLTKEQLFSERFLDIFLNDTG